MKYPSPNGYVKPLFILDAWNRCKNRIHDALGGLQKETNALFFPYAFNYSFTNISIKFFFLKILKYELAFTLAFSLAATTGSRHSVATTGSKHSTGWYGEVHRNGFWFSYANRDNFNIVSGS